MMMMTTTTKKQQQQQQQQQPPSHPEDDDNNNNNDLEINNPEKERQRFGSESSTDHSMISTTKCLKRQDVVTTTTETESETSYSSCSMSCSSGDMSDLDNTIGELKEELPQQQRQKQQRQSIRHRDIRTWSQRPAPASSPLHSPYNYPLTDLELHHHDDDDDDYIEEDILVFPTHKRSKQGLHIALAFFIVGTFSLLLSFLYISNITSSSASNNGGNHPRTSPLETELRRLRLEETHRMLSEIHAPRTSLSFSIVLNTRRNHRIDLIQNSIDCHSLCPRVKQIRVDWSGMMMDDTVTVPESIRNHKSGKVMMLETTTDGMMNGMVTDAVLLLEDDLIFDCQELDRAFSVWNQNPERLVGFFPYYHHPPIASPSPSTPFSFFSSSSPSPPNYQISELTTPPSPSTPYYNLLSTRAAFLHKSYLKSIIPQFPTTSPVLCQNLAYSLKITSVTNQPPIGIIGTPLELRSSAVYERMERIKREEEMKHMECLKDMMMDWEVESLPVEERLFVGEES